MKKLFILISITFCLYVCGWAQDPKPAPFPENWQIMGPEREFSIEVPITLDVEKDKDNKSFRYSGKLNDTYYFIFSEKKSEANGTKIGLRYINRFKAYGENISFGDINGERYGFRDDEGFFQRAVYLEIADRAYLFHTVSEENGNETIQRFFNSLMIRGRASSSPASLPIAPPPVADKPATVTPVVRGTGKVAGGGDGSGPGPGQVSAVDKPQVPPANATGPTQKVQLHTKPRAIYTDPARVYGIQGSVTLRIIFLAGGTIGAVTPVSKLPMGLTNTAIDAAKSITFDPARRNGVPYTVAATIQYGFTIY